MTDQIFTRKILKKTKEILIDTYYLFIDYKAAFDSPIRQTMLDAMTEFGIPAKLIRLCEMTLTDTKSSVNIGKNLTETFSTKRAFRQGDSLSCDLINIVMEMIMRTAAVKTGKVTCCSRMPMIDIIGRGFRDVTAAFSSIEMQSAEVGLVICEDKTKLFVSTNKESFRLGRCVNVGNYNFEVVEDFVNLVVKRRILIANRCYYALSRRTKIQLYQILILPVFLYSTESWVMIQANQSILEIFERKILRKIFEPIIVNGDYCRRMNHELYKLYNDIDAVKRVEIDRIRWLGHNCRSLAHNGSAI